MNRRFMKTTSLAAYCFAGAGTAFAQVGRDTKIEAVKINQNVYMLTGQGGNIGLSIGDDGAFLIDDQFAPLTPLILDAVRELTDAPVKFVVNTHFHGDHTGGNENLGEAGAIIVAHRNVRERMSTEQFSEAFNRTTPPAPDAALPVITFDDSITFHWNDDTIEVIHVDPAHTDGDSFIHFRDADVIHMGDIYFSNGYPFIDTSSGGTINGIIDAVDLVLERADDDTRFIPGHGESTGVENLRDYHEMLTTLRDRIQAMIDDGATRDEIVAAKPTAAFDAQWGGAFMKPDQWVGVVYDGLVE